MNTATSTSTAAVDQVFMIFIVISVALLLLVTVLMIYFVIRYNKKRHPVAVQIEGHTGLEILWTVIPTIIVLFMFYFGYEGFIANRTVPDDAMTVKVTGRMWDWAFEYENQKKSDKLYVPINKPIKLSLNSIDVVHSFYIPAFRLKEDATPGMENYLWFKPQTMGPADIFCAEYCGQSHAYMISKVIVMSQEDFDKWLNEGITDEQTAAMDKGLSVIDNYGCSGCHSVDGSLSAGPTFKGMLGRQKANVVIDEGYIKNAIKNPSETTATGHKNTMSAYKDISDEELNTIIEFLKTLK